MWLLCKVVINIPHAAAQLKVRLCGLSGCASVVKVSVLWNELSWCWFPSIKCEAVKCWSSFHTREVCFTASQRRWNLQVSLCVCVCTVCTHSRLLRFKSEVVSSIPSFLRLCEWRMFIFTADLQGCKADLHCCHSPYLVSWHLLSQKISSDCLERL